MRNIVMIGKGDEAWAFDADDIVAISRISKGFNVWQKSDPQTPVEFVFDDEEQASIGFDDAIAQWRGTP